MKDTTGHQDESEGAFHERMEPDSPDRCQGVGGSRGQCSMIRLTQTADGVPLSREESPYCRMHGGAVVLKKATKKAMNQYMLTKFKTQVDHFNSSDSIFSLRDEIGISRMMLQEILNRCDDANDLLLHSQKIGSIVTGIHKLVIDAKKLESQLGELMDKAAITRLCDAIITIVGTEVPAERLIAVSDKISDAIAIAVATRQSSEH